MPNTALVRIVLASCAMLITSACAPPPESPPVDLMAEATSAAATVSADDLRRWVTDLSDDKLAGRGPGSEGDQQARQYLVEQLQEIGFEPGAGDGGWEQPFDIVGVNAAPPETWTFQADGKKLVLDHWEDFIVSSGVQQPTAAIDGAEVVFVGYGIQAPEYGWDDYKGLDVTGKVLLMVNNDPDWDDGLFQGDRRLYYGRWTYKYEKAAEMGAAAAIIIHTTPSAGYPYQVVQTSWTGPQFEIPAGDEARIQAAAWTSQDATRRLFELADQDFDSAWESARSSDFQPVSLGVTTSLELTNRVERVQTANVLALLPGRDPELSKQLIVYSAHHDHLGVGKANDDGDDIYNGALDNGAGVAQVMSIGKAFLSLSERPRRSILLAFVAAEEQGLLGSAYYAAHPTAAPGLLAANINYDGGNIWGKNKDVTYIGYGKSSLDAVVDRFAQEQGRVVKGDQFPDRGFFYRSDQFNFAKVGVPAVYLDVGTEFVGKPAEWGREQIEAWEAVHYHQPSDEINDEWNYDGMIEDAVLGLKIGLWLSEQDEMPTWNAGDEFEGARQQALAALAAGD